MASTSMVMMMVLCVVMACMAPYAESITCGQVTTSLAPCFGYLIRGGAVPPACCSAVTGLNNAANSTPVRQTVCGCLKNIYASNSGINVNNAANLPSKCGVNIPYKISPSTECAKIQ